MRLMAKTAFSSPKGTHLTILLVLFCVIAYIYLLDSSRFQSFGTHSKEVFNRESSSQGARTDDDEICELPLLDPWDPSVRKYINPLHNPFKNCNVKRSMYTKLTDGRLQILDSSSASCWYRCLFPKGENSYVALKWEKMQKGSYYDVACDFVETECKSSNTTVFRYLHIQVKRPLTKKFQLEDNEHPSAILFILDSTSSSSGRRSMPETNEVLRLYYQATQFLYHNKVGLNSRPNAHAIFTGNRIENLDRSFFPKRDNNAEVWDSCKKRLRRNETILFDFVDAGYATLISEDSHIHAFNYPNCKGFKETPTDHFERPIARTWEASVKKDFRKYFYDGECEGTYHKAIKYASLFLKEYRGVSKFGYIWISEPSHGAPDGLYHLDKVLADFLRENAINLEGSFLFFMGDHGFRFGSIRKTAVGRHEDNNPYLTISVPRHLRQNKELISNLHRNSRLHTSHYDVYATLFDIAHIAKRSNFLEWGKHDFRNELGEIRGGKRAMSLLRPIGYNRTCKEMFISSSYCLCKEHWNSLDANSSLALEAGRALFNYINEFLASKGFGKECALLSLRKVARAKKHKTKPLLSVVAVASPHSGEYEARMFIDGRKYTDFSYINRNDRYGNQGHCANYEYVKSLCYCKRQLTAPEAQKAF